MVGGQRLPDAVAAGAAVWLAGGPPSRAIAAAGKVGSGSRRSASFCGRTSMRAGARPADDSAACSARPKICALGGRCSGLGCRPHHSTANSGAGTPIARRSGGGDDSARPLIRTSGSFGSSRNGGRPRIRVNTTDASAYTSTCGVPSPPRNSSGAAWTMMSYGSPERDDSDGSSWKSPINGSPNALTNRSSGLSLRCTRPSRCADSRAPETFTPRFAASTQSSRPPRRRMLLNVPSSSHSLMTYGRRRRSPEPK